MSSHCQRSHEDRFRGYVHDAENRLVSVSGGATASFVYDGDNQRVKGTAGGVTTVYVGNYYEVAAPSGLPTVKKYYYAGNQRVAMKSGSTVNWLLGDRGPSGRGSTAYTINGTAETGEVRYYAWGKDRYTSGTTPTSYKFTGQREEASLGLYYYGARWYDPGLGRFIQPDTVVPNPGDTQSFDRYAYTLNNPLKYSDPSGHEPLDPSNYPCSYVACVKEGGVWVPTGNWTPELHQKYYGYSVPLDTTAGPSISSILLQTAEALSKIDIPVEVSFAHGIPTLSFDQNKFTEAVSSPLKACASAIGGTCGAALGFSGNGAGAGARVSLAVYVDQNGNVGVFDEYGGGAYTPWPAPLSKWSVSGIPGAGIQDMDGMFGQFGVSGALGWLGAGGEIVFGRADNGRIIHGQSYSEAQTLPGTGVAEGHFTFTWGHPLILIDSNQ
ncbi:MAG: RHS repeat-associated core domain-containing protein [Caldilineaceae bacterium]